VDERVAGAPKAITCAICGRSLLVGEEASRFSPDGLEYVDVCPLCRGRAMEAGWYQEGGPSMPVRAAEPRRGFLSRLLGTSEPPPPAVAEPILSRLSPEEQVVVQAAALFNGSSHKRTIEGLIRSLGTPKAAIAPTGSRKAVITIYWDISWYRYVALPDEADPVQLLERGFDLSELDLDELVWSAEVDSGGRLVPEVSPD
jgi:hypothetical protein